MIGRVPDASRMRPKNVPKAHPKLIIPTVFGTKCRSNARFPLPRTRKDRNCSTIPAVASRKGGRHPLTGELEPSISEKTLANTCKSADFAFIMRLEVPNEDNHWYEIQFSNGCSQTLAVRTVRKPCGSCRG